MKMGGQSRLMTVEIPSTILWEKITPNCSKFNEDINNFICCCQSNTIQNNINNNMFLLLCTKLCRSTRRDGMHTKEAVWPAHMPLPLYPIYLFSQVEVTWGLINAQWYYGADKKEIQDFKFLIRCHIASPPSLLKYNIHYNKIV